MKNAFEKKKNAGYVTNGQKELRNTVKRITSRCNKKNMYNVVK